jgi:hypothetical protein
MRIKKNKNEFNIDDQGKLIEWLYNEINI